MATILIAIIYLAFVSMGLPDALLGSAWPSVYESLNIPISYAGLVTILMSSGTVISTLISDRLLRRFGTGLVTVGCTLLTVIALFGFSFSSAFWHLCVWALPYGFGGGSIDAALNNYVALKYKSRHMSWIHFFWGLGATIGPYIMSSYLTGGAAWTQGYRLVGFIQAGMTLILLLSLPMWKKTVPDEDEASPGERPLTKVQALRLPGAKPLLLGFFCYCALEGSAGLWAASYMTLHRGVAPEIAARWASIFYLGITAGRFFNGFIADRFGDKQMVRAGQICVLAGIALLLIPAGNWLCFAGLILIGLGDAPVYPCMLHQTPDHFGAQNSQTIMGLQMACAYIGSMITPPIFGLIADHLSIALYPWYLLLFGLGMLLLCEHVNRLKVKKTA